MSDEVVLSKRCVCCARAAELLCARCNDSYCSIECQKADWQLHRQICFKMPNLISDVGSLDKRFYSSMILSRDLTKSNHASPSTVYGSLEDLQDNQISSKPSPAVVAQTKAGPEVKIKETSASENLIKKPANEPVEIKAAKKDPVEVKAATKDPAEPIVQQGQLRKLTFDLKKEEKVPEPKKTIPVKENVVASQVKVPSIINNPIRIIKADEPKKVVPTKPIMFMDLKFRAWPDTKNVKTKILGMLESNVFTLREDCEAIDGYFQHIDQEVSTYCKSQGKRDNYSPIKGELILALFEGEWYRANVLDPKPDGIIVQYIDYGNMAIVNQSEVMPASKALMFDVCSSDFVIDNMPSELDEKQQEIIMSGAMTITNIHRVNAKDYHCNIFGF